MPASALASLLSALTIGTVFATQATAQSSLTTTFASNNGGAIGGMVYFDLAVANPAGVTIKKLDINTLATRGSVQVYTTPTSFVGVATQPQAWTLGATGALVPAGLNSPSEVCLGAGLQLPAGSYGIAIVGEDIAQRYTNGVAGTVVSNADLSLAIGAASNVAFGGSQFAPRMWNGTLHYDVGPTTTFSCAYTESFGDGCTAGATSWYQEFSDLASFDLAGSFALPLSIRAITAGPAGYIVVPATPAWYTPTGTALTNNSSSAPGPITASTFSATISMPFGFTHPGGTTSTLHAGSNGWVHLGPTNEVLDTDLPSTHTLLSDSGRLAPLWALLDPSANVATNSAAGIYFDVDPSGTAIYITWLDCGDARTGSPLPGTTSINMQCVIYSSGNFEFRYGPMQYGPGAGPAVVGWSPGATVPDPGSIDVSHGLPWYTNGPDSFPLEHHVGAAKLGSVLEFAVDEVPPLAPVAFLVVGDVAYPSGLSLAAAGAPGCSVFTNSLATATIPVTAGSGTIVLGVPQNPALIGSTFVSQCAAVAQQNALNLDTSNGVSWTIGN